MSDQPRPDQNLQGQHIEAPDNPTVWIGRAWRTRIAAALTCLLNPRIIVPVLDANGMAVPTDAKVTMGRNGWTALLPALATAASGGGSGPVPFSGAGAPAAGPLSAAFSYQSTQPPSLYVDTASNTLYRCSTSGTNSTSVWKAISSAPVSAFVAVLVSVEANSLTCIASGNYITVVKNPKLKNIGGETIDGVAITYTYSTTVKRTASGTFSGVPATEVQDVVPRFIAGDNILVAQLADGSYVDINFDARAWCRAYSQT